MGLVDIHSHILPGLDDGAKDMEEALAMARMAASDGVEVIAATPHSLDLPPHFRRDDALEAVGRLSEEIRREGIVLKVFPGVEAHISPDMAAELADERIFTLNGSRYILVELPLLFYPQYTEEALFQLQVKGLRPIIAHPERNEAMGKDPRLLYRLVSRGMLSQVTAASLVGVFGSGVRKLALSFLEHNLAQVIASDAHTIRSRSPVLSGGVAAAAEVVGEERALAYASTIPLAILEGKEVELGEPQEYKSAKRWFGIRFWGGRS